jgi:pyruvate dehydrogenase E1 component beta subunit
VSPYTAYEAKALLKSAIRDDNPVVFLEHEMLYGKTFDIPQDCAEILPLDKAIVMRTGTDVTITAFSISVEYALEAAQTLKEKFRISAEVINLVSLRPIDKDTIVESVKKTGRLLNVEEGWPAYGIGSEVVSVVVSEAFDYLDSEPLRIAASDTPTPYSPNLEQASLPDASKIVTACVAMLNRTQ